MNAHKTHFCHLDGALGTGDIDAMYEPQDPRLKHIAAALTPESWEARVLVAQARARQFEEMRRLRGIGMSVSAAIREVFPGEPLEARRPQYRRYLDEGVEGLINRRFVQRERVITAEMGGFIEGLLSANPELRCPAIRKAVCSRFKVTVGESTVREYLRDRGLSAPVGRPKAAATVTPLAMAGAELLKAVELELGAVWRLTTEMSAAFELLPAPGGEVWDDRPGRDELGRFQPDYNVAKPRTWPELGEKFESVEMKREAKDTRATRAANTGDEVLYRKNLAMTLLPLLAPSMRWDSLASWRGEALGELCGYAYQPATLDKYLRDLKYTGMAEVCRESFAAFWCSVEGPVTHPDAGVVVVYVDKVTNPVWTRHFTRSLPIGRMGGRVMPGTGTEVLNSGYGTPLVFRTVSGQEPLGAAVGGFLGDYEAVAGKGTARRLVVTDREAHSVGVFKELDEDWLFVIPLRSNVVGTNALFEDLTPWEPYRETDEACWGWLTLNDSRPDEPALRTRVVGRKRGRTGKVAWYATNTPSEFGAPVLLDIYFDRWPLQENVFRDAVGAVGLDSHHGYGKAKVANVAVLDAIDKLDGQIARGEGSLSQVTDDLAASRAELAVLEEAARKVTARIHEIRSELDEELSAPVTSPDRLRERLGAMRAFESWREEAQGRLDTLRAGVDKLFKRQSALKDSLKRWRAERDKLADRTEIFTVDTELDEILTAFKLTFLNLCRYLQRHYLDTKMETETLIAHVLTRPGQRVVTRTTETIQIWRQTRERRHMDAVEHACERLTAKGLLRDKRKLRFEVADKPEA
ncbi:MAG: hypothetical protein QME96_11800 [Myxococcota bacterium]|nr:hypothetical protein [Myxococcota bacterium]